MTIRDGVKLAIGMALVFGSIHLVHYWFVERPALQRFQEKMEQETRRWERMEETMQAHLRALKEDSSRREAEKAKLDAEISAEKAKFDAEISAEKAKLDAEISAARRAWDEKYLRRGQDEKQK